MPRRRRIPVGIALVVACVLAACSREPPPSAPWTDAEKRTLQSLSLASLPPLPPDPSNAVGDDPRAAALGHRLFFDTRLSANGEIACATCHRPDRLFADGRPRGAAIGTTRRHTPSIVGTASSPWLYWDGRRDSQWAQALVPLEHPDEHGGTRTQYVRVIARHYAEAYAAVFGPLPTGIDALPASAGPFGNERERAAWSALAREQREVVDRVYANLGKAIAAYERLMLPASSPFDDYVDALVRGDEATAASVLTADQLAGLRLFVRRGNCTQCHNGPLLTNHGFHNIGLPPAHGQQFDGGRIDGVHEAIADPFNCMSDFSDCPPGDCAELRFVKTEGLELIGAFKVPSLRNVAGTAPYMHDGRFGTLAEVLVHYDAAPVPTMGHSDLVPLELTPDESRQLEAFLETLSGGIAVDPRWLEPPSG